MDWHRLVRVLKQWLFPAVRKLPAQVYAELVVRWKQPHELVERLRCVCQKGEIEGQRVTLIRIVEPEELRGLRLQVREYADLDNQAAVIRYEGWFGYVPSLKVHLIPLKPSSKTF